MASIIKDVLVNADSDAVWEALCDFDRVHERVARGFVTATAVDRGPDHHDRIVTFANGAVARERLVACDDQHRRIVYSVVESDTIALDHHQASVEVVRAPSGARLRWITDVLPDSAAVPIGMMMDAGATAIAATLAGAATGR